MVTRFFMSKRTKENTPSKSKKRGNNQVQDVGDIFDPYGNEKPNGACVRRPAQDEYNDMVPELLHSNISTPMFVVEPSPTPSTRRGLLEQLSSSEFTESAAPSRCETPSRHRRKFSLDLDTIYEPPKHIKNRLLTSCAISSTRNSLNVSGVAAAFYNGGWLPSSGQISADKSIARVNEFIAETRAEIDSGLPGRLLTIIIGSSVATLDSVVSTIAYAYFLHTNRRCEDHCFVPVINMKRQELHVHSEISWLFRSVALDIDSLIFADEISLTYYYRFNNLKIVLVNEYEDTFEHLKDTIVEILEQGPMENSTEKAAACSTLVAEKFAKEAPDLLLGRGFGRLLLAGILLGTYNLDPLVGQCSNRDVCMATLLLNGAGRYGCNGFYKMLRKKMSDLSVLSPREILNKEVKQWISKTGSSNKAVRIGMSSMAIPLGRFLSVETAVSDEFSFLQRSKKLDILLVATSYYDKYDKFKRELLITTESGEVIEAMVEFYNAETLQLHPLSIIGMDASMKAFEQRNISVSPARIHQLTDAFVNQC